MLPSIVKSFPLIAGSFEVYRKPAARHITPAASLLQQARAISQTEGRPPAEGPRRCVRAGALQAGHLQPWLPARCRQAGGNQRGDHAAVCQPTRGKPSIHVLWLLPLSLCKLPKPMTLPNALFVVCQRQPSGSHATCYLAVVSPHLLHSHTVVACM